MRGTWRRTRAELVFDGMRQNDQVRSFAVVIASELRSVLMQSAGGRATSRGESG